QLQVHSLLCQELHEVVNKVSKILPEIEAVRPGCSSGIGIEALCVLINELDKAKSVLHHCRVSSKLYLVLTGESILLRCKKSRSILEQCLNQIQNMVHVELASEIIEVLADIKRAKFSLDPCEEEAGKVLLQLLHEYATESDSIQEISSSAIQVASTRLHIRSALAVSKEKTSIKKMLSKGGDSDSKKRKILLLFLDLLNKYGKQFT
ncbi:hypothetical protein Leryth_007017, partial [Lithospermum erythrorhizon]